MHNADDKDVQERQLREFLERAVPLLQAPPDRMRHVHGRVMASRRRRKALTATVAGGAAAALLYGSLGSQPFGVPASPPTQVASPSSKEHRIALADGVLTLDLPDGWYAREQADQRAAVTVFVTDRPLPATTSCPTATTGDYDCAPLSALAEGEAVISFRETDRPVAIASGTEIEPSPYPRPGDGCRSLGGDQELVRPGWRSRPGEAQFPVDVHVCLKGPSATTLAEARGLLETAAYDAATSAPAPEASTDFQDGRK